MWNQVENANEQLPTKTPEEYIQDFAKIMKSPNYSFQQIDEDDDDFYVGVVVPEDYKEEPPPPPPPEMYDESL